ncbi:MAG: IclR family transcriptional regulator [Roseovarius sp.]
MDSTVVKAFSLLELLAKSEEPLGVTELASRLGFGKSNVHRLLQTLIALDYVQKTDGAGYMATLRMWEFGSSIVSRVVLRDIARPTMRNLSSLTKEAVHLSQYEAGEVIYLDKIESKEPVRAYTQLGGRAPAYCTATGKIMMAYLTEAEVRHVYETVQASTPNTITDVDRFLSQCAEARTRHYALNTGEWRADIIGLAAPIADRSGVVVSAIGISAPASRLSAETIERYAPDLVQAGREISMQLGCSAERWEALGRSHAAPMATAEH